MAESEDDGEGGRSISEQFGVRWSSALDRYVRTWLDYVFLSRTRFVGRYEARRARYTAPVVFFADSVLLAGVGIWGVGVIASASGDAILQLKPSVAAEALVLFGRGMLTILICGLAVLLSFKRPRVRSLFRALAYSTSLFVLVPLALLIQVTVINQYGMQGFVEENVFSLLFSAVDTVYLLTTVAAFHHLRLRRFAPAFVAALVVLTLVGVAIGFGIDALTPWMDEEFSSGGSPTLASVDQHFNTVLVNKVSRSPMAEEWSSSASVSERDHLLHVRIAYRPQHGTASDVHVQLMIGNVDAANALFMAVIKGTNTPPVTGYALIGGVRRENCQLEHVMFYPCDCGLSRVLPKQQTGNELTTPAGLSLGNLSTSARGYIVATFKIAR